jgi:hypothetical protein
MMKRKEYIEGLRLASTVEELEAAIHAPYSHSWNMIGKIIRERAETLCAIHPNSRFVPLRKGKQLEICGESHSCGRGGGYYGYGAEEVVKGALRRNGFSQIATYRIWEWATSTYLHRCIPIIADALDGKLPDPPMNCLIFAGMSCAGPVNISVEANAADDISHRATRPCECGGTLFDWGSGYSDGFNFVSWRCNKCPRTYSEWVTDERFREIRQPSR